MEQETESTPKKKKTQKIQMKVNQGEKQQLYTFNKMTQVNCNVLNKSTFD